MSLSHRLGESLHRFGDRRAVSESGPGGRLHSMTYAELAAASAAIARELVDAGCGAGDPVILYQQRSAQTVAAMLAVLSSGGFFCPIDARVPPAYALAILKRARSRFLVVDEDSLARLSAAGFRGGKNTRVLITPRGGPAPEAPPWARRVLPEGSMEPTPRVAVEPGEAGPACCLFTSGSTGTPKGVLISRADLLERAFTEVGDYLLEPSDVLLGLLPFSFDVGLNQLFSCLLAGAELVLSHSWFPMDIVKTCESLKVTGISGVPAIWAEMIRIAARVDLPERMRSVRYITVSAGSLSLEELARLPSIFPEAGVYRTYGQTETFRSGILRPSEYEGKMASVGRAVQGVSVFVINDKGKSAGPDEVGEIVHAGAGTMIGYLHDKAATQRKVRRHPFPHLRPGDPERVVFTGDIGKLDADGYLYVLGRLDRMLKSSGYRVYPLQIENALRAHPAVRDAAVVGGPDGAPIAEVVLNAEAAASPPQILAFLAGRLPSYMLPRKIVPASALPRTLTGKIDYAEIEGKYRERA